MKCSLLKNALKNDYLYFIGGETKVQAGYVELYVY